MLPRTRYARSGDLSIAYQVVGNGPVDLVLGLGFVSHIEYAWEEPGFAYYLRRLASFSRLILFDKRGTGLSDRAAGVAPLAERMDDVRAVMDAAGSTRAVLFGSSESGPLMALFAATYPERTAALVLYGTFASAVRAPDYPWRPPAEEVAATLDASARTIHESWGAPAAFKVTGDAAFRHWFSTYLRLSASPGAAVALRRMNAAIDVRHVLPAVRVPTLVLHRTGDPNQQIAEGRYVAAHIPGARFVELPGNVHHPYAGDTDALLDHVEAFVTGARPVGPIDQVLVTVLTIEAAGANGTVLPAGDPRHERFGNMARAELTRFRGRALEPAGGRMTATFDGPGRAIHCAGSIREAAGQLGLTIRAGLHTGECEVHGEGIRGVAMTLAAWVMDRATPGEILLTGAIKDLVVGSPFCFADRGGGAVAGVPGVWRLFAVSPDAEFAPSSAPVPSDAQALPPATLTRREREVLPLVAQGLSNRQLAAALGISERTAESHVAGLLAKLGMTRRAQLGGWATADDATAIASRWG